MGKQKNEKSILMITKIMAHLYKKSKTMIPKAPKKLNSTHHVMQRYKCLRLFMTTILRMEKVSSLCFKIKISVLMF